MANFIFIHGSFHAAWNWHKVIPLIDAAGHQAIALDMPGHGLDHQPTHEVTLRDCVDSVIKAIDSVKGKVILVAHSRNGMVISQVAEYRSERIERLVYLAAYLVPNGKSMMDYGVLDKKSLVYQNIYPRINEQKVKKILHLYKKPFFRTLLNWFIPAKHKLHALDPQVFKEALYHDCPDEITELANVLLIPEPNFPGFEPLKLTDKRYGRVPKTYIECLQDRAVTIEIQRLMQRDSRCDSVFQLDSSHSPFFSQPKSLVNILIKLISCSKTNIATPELVMANDKFI